MHVHVQLGLNKEGARQAFLVKILDASAAGTNLTRDKMQQG